MIPSSVLLVFLVLLVLVMPLACQRMTPLQQQRWSAWLVVVCMALLVCNGIAAAIFFVSNPS